MANLGLSDVYYYSSDMVGAPSLTYLPGTWINVVKQCLIDGFGSEAPQGSWEILYESGNKAAFRSTDADATGGLLRVDDVTATRCATLRMYETMPSGIDSGTGPGPVSTDRYFYRYNEATVYSVPWRLYADSRAFYLFSRPMQEWTSAGAYWSQQLLFGDAVSRLPGDAYGCVLIAAETASASASWAEQSGAYGQTIARGYAQTGGAITGLRYFGMHGPAYIGTAALGRLGDTYPNPMDGKTLITPISLWDDSTHHRGWLPGFYNPMHSLSSVAQDADVNESAQLPGRVLRNQRVSYNESLHSGLIDITGPWRDDGSLSISGTVTEMYVPGVYQVVLSRQADKGVVKTTWSDSSGAYSFTGLKQQKYIITLYDHTTPLRDPVSKAGVVPS